MRKGEQTKARLISTTIDLVQRQGFGETGLSQILSQSDTNRGSLYFHFPGGKHELVLEALRAATQRWRDSLQAILKESDNAPATLRSACDVLGQRLERSGWQKGCPVATVTLELAATDDAVREICAEHFRLWEDFLAEVFLRDGATPEEAAKLASFALAAIEGALVLARAYESTAPLDNAAELLGRLAT